VQFARFEQGKQDASWADVVTRPLREDDVPRVAELLAERHRRDASHYVPGVSSWLTAERQLALVAERLGVPVGYGRAEWLEPSRRGGHGPDGWYLSGLLVAQAARRHGIGDRLTAARIAMLAGRAPEVWYFANTRNLASIALHDRHGFVRQDQDFELPGLTFDGGSGVLFRLETGPP
jgi:ribosomal protein S18 acetylase RimI-like enzyme